MAMMKIDNKCYKIVGGGKTDNSMKRVVWAKDANEADLFLSWHDPEFLEVADEERPVLLQSEYNGMMPSGTVLKWEDWLAEQEAKEKATKKATSAGSKSSKRNS